MIKLAEKQLECGNSEATGVLESSVEYTSNRGQLHIKRQFSTMDLILQRVCSSVEAIIQLDLYIMTNPYLIIQPGYFAAKTVSHLIMPFAISLKWWHAQKFHSAGIHDCLPAVDQPQHEHLSQLVGTETIPTNNNKISHTLTLQVSRTKKYKKKSEYTQPQEIEQSPSVLQT